MTRLIKEKGKDYKCPDCGAEGKYTLYMERYITQIYDGPNSLPIGYNDQGGHVTAWCNVCKFLLDPTMEDFDRLYAPRKGVVFYDKENLK